MSPQASKPAPQPFDWSSQGTLVLGGVLLLLIILYAVVGSSKYKADQEKAASKTVKYGNEWLPLNKFIGLESTRKENDPQLVAEIKSVLKEDGSPADVFADDVPPGNNIGTELDKSFRIYDENPGELEKLRSGVSYGDWAIDRKTLEETAEILTRTDPKRLGVRKLLDRADMCFSFEFVKDDEQGSIPQTDAADYLADYMLLEEYAVAQALQDGTVNKAAESLAYIFRIAQLAAEVRNVSIRTKAAQMRLHAVDVLQTVLQHPKLQKEDLQFLCAMLKEQLVQWTPDREMWVGDRAGGLKCYNLVRLHGLDGALEPEEIDELKTRGIYNTFSRQLLKRIVADEVFYLQTMRNVIEQSQKPFYQRLTALNNVEEQLRAKWGTENEPVIAGFLLRHIKELMQYCALDRTKCETAVLAMETALNIPVTVKMETLYGKDYEVQKSGKEIRVTYPNNPKPFRIPDFSAIQ